MDYEQAVDYIENTPRFTKKTRPENTKELLRRIGHPERDMKVIHVAGTNGKGSVCAFLASVLLRAGFSVGLFTSPHLVDLTERFVIDGEQVSRETFTRAFERILQVTREMIRDGYEHPAYFELLFATGLVIFKEAAVEYLVMETGLGGRLDATNQVEHPIACVITSISMDHMEYLGNTIEEIAREKAGIIKKGVPVVYDGRNPEAAEVIGKRAKELRAPALKFEDSMCRILRKTDKSIDFILDSGYDEKMNVHVPFPAPYQVVNSSLALLTLRVIDPARRISADQALAAIAQTSWPGRMETVLPGVVLDGAHNADGVRELIRTIQGVREGSSSDGEVSLLFSAVADKEYDKMIEELCEAVPFSSVITTQLEGERAVPAEELAALFRGHTDAPVTAQPDVAEAFDTALRQKGDGMLFCAGSLYLIGELKKILSAKEYTDD